MNKLWILQYNVEKSKDKVMILLIDGPHEPYNIIAIQEQWPNLGGITTDCSWSCPYYLVHCQTGHGRAYLYVNKAIPISKWQAGGEPDYCWVRLETDTGPITIHSIYSEKMERYRTTDWNTPILRMLEATETQGEHVVVGDFNLYHPAWGGRRVLQSHAGAEPLVYWLETGELELLLELGTKTREKHKNEPSTLDLCFCTPGLAQQVTKCMVTDQHGGSDHKPIETVFQLGNTAREEPEPRWNFQKMNTEAVMDGARWLQVLAGAEQATCQEVDAYTEYLVTFIQELICKMVPRSKQAFGQLSKAWWTAEIGELVAAERRCYREWGCYKVCIIKLVLLAMVWEDTMAIYLVSSHPALLPLVIQTKLHT